MTIAIMQPYLFPYIGYFQLINAVDKFVVYDEIEYTKKGWINRNRILMNGTDHLFTIPIKNDSDFLHVNKRFLADNYPGYKKKIKNQVSSAYSKSPQFNIVYPVIEECLDFDNYNLFEFLFNAVSKICDYADIKTEFVISSNLNIDADVKGEKKVIEINKILNSSLYINAIGGLDLYIKENFLKANIKLKFLKTDSIHYPQFKNEFIANLSIIDVMMFNSKEKIKGYLSSFTLI